MTQWKISLLIRAIRTVYKDISERLTSLRIERGLTQAELAIEIEISNKVISKWERGISVPSVEVLLRLAKYYNMSLDELVDSKFIEKRNSIAKTDTKAKRKLPICKPMVAIEIITILLILVATVLFAVRTNSFIDLIPIYDPDGILVAMYTKSYAWMGYIIAIVMYIIVTVIQSLVKFRPRLSYIVDSLEIDKILTNESDIDKVFKMMSSVVAVSKLIIVQYIMLMSWEILYSFPYLIWTTFAEIGVLVAVMLIVWGMSVGYVWYLKKTSDNT